MAMKQIWFLIALAISGTAAAEEADSQLGARPLTLPGLGAQAQESAESSIAAMPEQVSEEEVPEIATGAVTAPPTATASQVDAGAPRDHEQVDEESVRDADRAATISRQPALTRVQPSDARKARNARLDGVVAPPPVIELRSGQNAMLAVAFAHLNRIVTPFDEPVVQTTSTAQTKVDGSLLYVATNVEEPIALFVHNKDEPEVAFSLTLVPAEIPPISTEVRLVGEAPQRASSRKSVVVEEAAKAFETSHAYPQMLTTLLRDIALGKVPDGFGLELLHGPNPWMPACRQPNVHVQPAQLVVGSSVMAFVAKATNIGHSPLDLDESACDAPHVRAVAAWPTAHLAPGQSTELYLVVSLPEEVNTSAARPSLIGAN
jgi:conjugal transfer pilus assembly protein TraK